MSTIHNLFGAIDISASALSVQRTRLNTISENIANAETTRSDDGQAYRRKQVVVENGMQGGAFSDVLRDSQLQLDQTQGSHMPKGESHGLVRCCSAGVHVAEVTEDPSPYKMVYDPTHPDADEDGYVAMPNVNLVQEMTDLISASRSYEANVTALNSAKEMIRKAIKI